MRIMIETTAPLSATDYQILNLLLERHTAEVPAEGAKAPKISGTIKADKVQRGTISATVETPANEKPLDTKKLAKELKAEKLAESHEVERAEALRAAEDLAKERAEEAAEQDQPVTEATMDAAVAEAKKLLQGGDKAKVKDALGTAGVAKVGAIETEGQALAFLAALKG